MGKRYPAEFRQRTVADAHLDQMVGFTVLRSSLQDARIVSSSLLEGTPTYYAQRGPGALHLYRREKGQDFSVIQHSILTTDGPAMYLYNPVHADAWIESIRNSDAVVWIPKDTTPIFPYLRPYVHWFPPGKEIRIVFAGTSPTRDEVLSVAESLN